MSVPADNINVYKDTDKNVPLYISGGSGAVDLTSDNVYLFVRETISGDPIITKDTDLVGGITIDVDQVTNPGKCIIRIDREDTVNLASGKYYFQVFHDDGTDYKAVVMGYFWVLSVAPTFINLIRNLLDEGGELRVLKVPDEMIYPSNLTTIYVSRPRILSVEGVWVYTDSTHVLTNYYTGGGFDASKGKIWLGTPLVSAADFVRVSYSWESGLADETIQWHLDASRVWAINYTGIDFIYGDAVTMLQQGCEALSLAAAILGCILSLNGANVAQMGYNFRLHEFEVQTKLWGEGMIAEALFGVYIQQIKWWLETLGKKGDVYLVNRATTDRKYNIETLLSMSNSVEGGEL